MRRLRLPITRILALLLLAQWTAAFAQCFAVSAEATNAHTIEVCSADGGIRTILVGEDGRPVPESALHHPACPECGGPVALEPGPPSAAAAPVVWFGPVRARRVEGLPAAPARAPPQQPRAPPAA